MCLRICTSASKRKLRENTHYQEAAHRYCVCTKITTNFHSLQTFEAPSCVSPQKHRQRNRNRSVITVWLCACEYWPSPKFAVRPRWLQTQESQPQGRQVGGPGEPAVQVVLGTTCWRIVASHSLCSMQAFFHQLKCGYREYHSPQCIRLTTTNLQSHRQVAPDTLQCQ